MTWAEAFYHAFKWLALAVIVIALMGGVDISLFSTKPPRRRSR